MILKLILKYWRLLLDIAIVVAVVIFLSLLDPFGWFGTKLRLQDTANMVTKVKDIAQLVTAEYYGEVIASLHEAELAVMASDSSDEEAFNWYVMLKYDLFDLYLLQQDEKRKAQRKAVTDYYKSTVNTLNEEYFNFALFFRQETMGRKNWNGKKEKKKEQYYKEVIYYVFDEIKHKHKKLGDVQFNEYLNENFFSPKTYKEYSEKVTDNKLKRKNLAMIGRGGVKAGFNFETLDENRFIYDDKRLEVHLFGVKPVILDADINPWFIPQNKIQGFQILSAHGKPDFYDAKKVKEKCISKLREKAIEADIIKNAEIYGKETLKDFFTLMTGQEIKSVVFHSNPLDYAAEEIGRDNLVSYTEVNTINKTVQKIQKEIDSLQNRENVNPKLIEKRKYLLHEFLGSLRKLKYGSDTSDYRFNYYCATANSWMWNNSLLINDSTKTNEYDSLVSLRYNICRVIQGDSTSKDSATLVIPETIKKSMHWFSDNLSFISDYNAFVKMMVERNPDIIKPGKDTTRYNQYQGSEYNAYAFNYNPNNLNLDNSSDSSIKAKIERIRPDSLKQAEADSMEFDAYYNFLRAHYQKENKKGKIEASIDKFRKWANRKTQRTRK